MLYRPPVKSTIHGSNSTYFLGMLIWNQLPSSIKSIKSTAELKRNLEQPELLTGAALCLINFFFSSFILVTFFFDRIFLFVSWFLLV